MTYQIGLETRKYCTVTVCADNADEAVELAIQKAKDEHFDVSWNEMECDTADILSVSGSEPFDSDRLYDERREEWIA